MLIWLLRNCKEEGEREGGKEEEKEEKEGKEREKEKKEKRWYKHIIYVIFNSAP